MEFCIAFTSVRDSIVSTIIRICIGRSGVQILDRGKALFLLQNIHASSSTHPASNTMKNRAISVAVKWPGQIV